MASSCDACCAERVASAASSAATRACSSSIAGPTVSGGCAVTRISERVVPWCVGTACRNRASHLRMANRRPVREGRNNIEGKRLRCARALTPSYTSRGSLRPSRAVYGVTHCAPAAHVENRACGAYEAFGRVASAPRALRGGCPTLRGLNPQGSTISDALGAADTAKHGLGKQRPLTGEKLRRPGVSARARCLPRPWTLALCLTALLRKNPTPDRPT